MRVNLLFENKNYKFRTNISDIERDKIQDLGLDVIIKHLSKSNEHLKINITSILMDHLKSDNEINYRLEAVDDALRNADVTVEFYNLIVELTDHLSKKYHGIIENSPQTILTTSNSVLEASINYLQKLLVFSQKNSQVYKSKAFSRLFSEIKSEITPKYLEELEEITKELKFDNGALISAKIGPMLQSTDYELHKYINSQANKLKWRMAQKVVIMPQDHTGGADFNRRMDKGINKIANVIAQLANHFSNYFNILREEMTFFICAINLATDLMSKKLPLSYPTPTFDGMYEYEELYDMALSLRKKDFIVGNKHNINDKRLIIITGANQGGKSTYLRSIGQAQILMQAGLFVPAKSYTSRIVDDVYTHFSREEDVKMESGKLDEELKRMNKIISLIKSNSMILFNESFSSTNEREGSEIARQITMGLIDSNMIVFYVTHMYDLSYGLYEKYFKTSFFLRAGRLEDGKRSFIMGEAEPLRTSYAMDIFNSIFTKTNE